MGESVTNVPCFQQSVSFGRFERDSLSWEKWSTFPTNRYLEEVEKFSTPGSVAQKKAYFEAHYKKIAARKALLLDQETNRETELDNYENSDALTSIHKTNEQELGNENEGGFDGDVNIEHVHVKSNSDDVFNQENTVGGYDGEASVEVDVDVMTDELSGDDDVIITFDDASESSIVISEKCDDVDVFTVDDNTIEEVKIEVVKNIPEQKDYANVIHGADLIEGDNKRAQEFASEIPHMGGLKESDSEIESKGEEELPLEKVKRTIVEEESGNVKKKLVDLKLMEKVLPQEKVKRTIVEEASGNLVKSANLKTMQKATLVKKTTNTTDTKKKPTAPVSKRNTAPMPKSPMLSTSKSSKPDPTKLSNSANRLSNKKESSFTPPTVKKTVGPQSKRLVPTSLHMSLNFGSMNTDQSMRKSLIMERMGDKDIVKRAFKAFQNTPHMLPSSFVKSPVMNQSVSRKAEHKGPPANTLLKKNDGIGKVAKTANTRTGELGTRKTLLSTGVNKNGGGDQRNVKFVATSFGQRVQLQGNSRKEDSKKLELKAKTNAFEETNLQSKLKVEKASQVKKLSQSINSKPKLPSTNNRRHGGLVCKEDSKA